MRPESLFEVETTCDFDRECLNGGHCETEVGIRDDSSHCVCDPAYTGHHCELPVQEKEEEEEEATVTTHPPTAVAMGCDSDEDCQNGGRCDRNNAHHGGNGAGRCECPVTHYGFRCEEECPCLHGGTCLNSPSTGLYQCQCTDEFYDVLCTTRFDGITLPGHHRNRDHRGIWSIVGCSLGLFVFLVLWFSGFPAATIRRRGRKRGARGIVGTDDKNGGYGWEKEGDDSGMAIARGAGNPGVERIPTGRIVYRDRKEESEVEDGLPTIRDDPSTVDSAVPTNLSDLELT